MRWASDAARAHAELASAGFGIGDKLGNRARWNRWVHNEDKSVPADARDRRDVADEIEAEVVVERRIYGVRYAAKEESVAICLRTYDHLGREIAPGTWPIL